MKMKWFPEVRLGLLFFIHASSESYMRDVDFLRYNSTHHTQPIREMIFVCVCWECLTFSQRAGFTQRLCYTSTILLIAGQKLLSGRRAHPWPLDKTWHSPEQQTHSISEIILFSGLLLPCSFLELIEKKKKTTTTNYNWLFLSLMFYTGG